MRWKITWNFVILRSNGRSNGAIPQTEAAYAKHASKNPHRAHTNAIPALVLVLLDSLLRNTEEPQPEWVHCSRSTRTAESWHALRSTSRNVRTGHEYCVMTSGRN